MYSKAESVPLCDSFFPGSGFFSVNSLFQSARLWSFRHPRDLCCPLEIGNTGLSAFPFASSFSMLILPPPHSPHRPFPSFVSWSVQTIYCIFLFSWTTHVRTFPPFQVVCFPLEGIFLCLPSPLLHLAPRFDFRHAVLPFASVSFSSTL